MTRKILLALRALLLVTPLLAGCEAHGNVDKHDFNVDVTDKDQDHNHNHDHHHN